MRVSRLFSISGRATRGEWWGMNCLAFFLGLIGIVVAVGLLFGFDEDLEFDEDVEFACGILVILVVGAITWLMTFAVTVRRLHDRGHSGWLICVYWLLNCVPFVNFVSGLIYLLDVGCIDGFPGSNQYGDDPKGRKFILSGGSLTVVNNVATAQKDDSPEARLRMLAKLKDEHILTEQEYQQQRCEVISGI